MFTDKLVGEDDASSSLQTNIGAIFFLNEDLIFSWKKLAFLYIKVWKLYLYFIHFQFKIYFSKNTKAMRAIFFVILWSMVLHQFLPIFSKLQRMNELEYYLYFMYARLGGYWPLSDVLLTIFKLEENLFI